MTENKIIIQLIWGIALVFAGIGVFYRIPQIMPRIETIPYFAPGSYFIRFCFYVMGILLTGGGIKKILNNLRKIRKSA
jgi:hypothetical protein